MNEPDAIVTEVPAVSDASVIWNEPEGLAPIIKIACICPEYDRAATASPVDAAFAVPAAGAFICMAIAVRLLGACMYAAPSLYPVGHAIPGLAPTVAVAVRSKK